MELELPEGFEIPASPFDDLIGTEWISDDPDGAVSRFRVRPELRQPAGIVHGGVFSTAIEGLCSRATFMAVLKNGMACMGQSLSVSFLRSIPEGTAEIRAVARHRGRTTWVWEAEIFDEKERLCVTALMTVAVRPLPAEVIERYK